ncbi:MAG TPA: four helix bundle protein [Verrucomicrobiae bacterium]
MATIQEFEQLKVWQEARALVKAIYSKTAVGALAKDFGLRDQLRRAAVSIASNIAEEFERSGNKEFIHFLYIAKGSAGEVRTQLYIAFDLNYLSEPDFGVLRDQAEMVARQLSNFIKYLVNCPPTSAAVSSKRRGARSQRENLQA